MKRLLLADGAIEENAGLRNFLSHHGFYIRHVHTAQETYDAVLARRAEAFDVLLLEAALPDCDGFKVCAHIRKHTAMPLIMVSSYADPNSRMRGLYLGADDYVTKPYHKAELLARIHAVKRRNMSSKAQPVAPIAAGVIRIGPVSIDPACRNVAVSGRTIALTYKEYEILYLMASHPGIVFRRDHILNAVWGSNWHNSSRTLEVHVASLRAKLGDFGIIQTVRGVGYRVTDHLG